MPINRDTLIKALHCCSRTDAKASGCDACPLECCGEDCNNLCEEAAVALEQMQWRSLDDEWPGDGDEVLVAPSLLTARLCIRCHQHSVLGRRKRAISPA